MDYFGSRPPGSCPAFAGMTDLNNKADTMWRKGFVYILASKRNGTLYTGVTSDLPKRVWQHKKDTLPGFTAKYQVHSLVYFEEHDRIDDAILREKQIKKWNRAWKIRLIEEANPEWRDLYDEL